MNDADAETLSLSNSSGRLSLAKLLHGLPGLEEAAPLSPRTPRSPSTHVGKNIEEANALLIAFTREFSKQAKTFRNATEKQRKSSGGRISEETLQTIACSVFGDLTTPFHTLDERLTTLFHVVKQSGNAAFHSRDATEPSHGTTTPPPQHVHYHDLMQKAEGNPCLNIHLKNLKELLLKPRDGTVFPFHNNLAQLRQFTSEEPAKLHHLAFNYLAHVLLIGATLRQFKSQLPSNIPDGGPKSAAAFMPEIKKFMTEIEKIAATTVLDQRSRTVDQHCDELGAFLTAYAEYMAAALKSYLIEHKGSIPSYLTDYFPNINDQLTRRLIRENCEFSFEADFHRSQMSGCISLSSDRRRISTPALDEAAREEKSGSSNTFSVKSEIHSSKF